jgi:2-polyprenyl-3-methyl-5-hydroxy-6-metoxy-1,4-benzoquinol methylase
MSESRMTAGLRHGAQRGVALGYGLAYDAVVSTFPPYQSLLNEVVSYAARSVAGHAGGDPGRVLDVAAGVGTLAFKLARAGYSVTAIDPVEHLIAVAEGKRRSRGVPNVDFQHLDIGSEPIPWPETFDFAVSLHTLYWHPRPERVLEATWRSIKPGAHALVLNYARPAGVGSTFGQVRAREGIGRAIRALRWLVPTAIFESLRDHTPHFTEPAELRAMLTGAGFEVLEMRRSFLADVSVLAWVRRDGCKASAE